MLPKLPPISEAKFQERTIQLARACGFLVYHTADSRRSESGFPDIVLISPPCKSGNRKGKRIVAFIELKTEIGKLTEGHYDKRNRYRPGQKDWLEALHDADWVMTRIWRPSDSEEIEDFLTRKGNGS